MPVNKKPNIIVFLTDQQRYDSLGCNGNNIIKTPNIDSIAYSGINFTQAYCCQPLCVPQRCSMLTGLYPSVHGSTLNGVPLSKNFPVYPELLRRSGYQTFASGKMHFGPISRGFAKSLFEPGEVPDKYPYYGFEKVNFVEGEKSQYLKMIKKKHPDLWEAANHYPPKDETSELFQTYTNPIPEKLHRSTWITDHTIKFLEQRNKNKPFLLHCSFWDPHHPFAPPIPYNTIYNPIDMPEPIPSKENEFKNLPEHFLKFYTKEHNTKSGIRRYKSFKRYTMEDWKKIIAHYYGMISLIDKNIGRVLDYLRKENLLESTAIFFTSDHGELLGDHGLLTKGNYHYEGLLRVPFIFSYPYLYKGGRIFDNLILSYDLMPTILELAGVDKPKITAKSIIPLIKNRESPRKTVLIEGTNNIRTIIYKKKYKLTMYKESDEGELFDLKNDPNETKNLWKTEKKFKLMLLLELNKLQMGAIKPSEDCIGIW